MPLANLLNIPGDPQSLSYFSFSNADEHRQIRFALNRQKNIQVDDVLLDPIPQNDPSTWARIHQQVHTVFEQILGIQGNDLTDVDFNKPDQVASWIRLHFDSHRQASQILGLS